MKDIANKVDSVDTLPANAFNSIASELENVVTDSGQTLDTTAETDPDPTPTQISRAITEGSLSADFYTDSGAADAYVLTVSGSWRQPTAYVTGMAFRFIPDNANTGASTVNISGLGVKTIKQEDGTALLGGQLAAAKTVSIYYDGTDFKLIEAGSGAGGLGGVNLLEDEANAAAGVGNWVSSGATLAVAQETSTIPLNGVRDTAIKLTVGGAPNVGDYQAIRFTMSTSLKRLLLGIKWFQQVSAYNADALKVELYYNAASNYGGAYTEVPLSSDITGDTSVPDANDPVSNITYMEMGNDYYELRFVVTASAVGNEIVYINDLETGPDNTSTGFAGWRQYDISSELTIPTIGSGSISLATAVPYKTSDGVWRLRFNIIATGLNSSSVQDLTVGGVKWSAAFQAGAASGDAGGSYTQSGNASTDPASLIVRYSTVQTNIRASGDFELSEMPGWAADQSQVNLLDDNVITSNARMRAERTNSSTISTTDTVIFEDETNDNVSAYNPTTGIYTTKSEGDFNVFAMIKFTATTTAVSVLSIEHNGTIVSSRTFDTPGSQASLSVRDTLTCAKGDTIEIVWAGDATSPAFSLTAADNIFLVERKADYSSRQPTGFGLGTPIFAGFVNAEKQYVGGIDFTIASDAVATVVFQRSVIIPYQTYNGVWRAKITITMTHGADTSHDITITGITFKNVTSYLQPLSTTAPSGRAFTLPNAETIQVDYTLADTATRLAGDVELESKPTWAD